MLRHACLVLGAIVLLSGPARTQDDAPAFENLTWNAGLDDVRTTLERYGEPVTVGACDLLVSNARVFGFDDVAIRALLSPECRLLGVELTFPRPDDDATGAFFTVRQALADRHGPEQRCDFVGPPLPSWVNPWGHVVPTRDAPAVRSVCRWTDGAVTAVDGRAGLVVIYRNPAWAGRDVSL